MDSLLDPLIWTRAIHFAATIAATGAIFFLAFVAEPAFRKAQAAGGTLAAMRAQLSAFTWVALVTAIVSGSAWLLLLSAQVADLPVAQAAMEGMPWTVLTDTDFGKAWTVRLVIAGLLAASLPWLAVSSPVLSRQRATVAIVLAAALVGTLAWAGHAVSGTGLAGGVHLAADILHLVAAAAWVGALIPLFLLLRAAMTDRQQTSLAIARVAVLRFSTLGIVSVGTLVGSGLINTWVLAGSIEALIGTDYGRLLLAKIALFLVMLAFAAVNRLWLTPRLTSSSIDLADGPLRGLGRNTVAEAALGAIVIVVVAVLGTLQPGLDALAN
jgi:putative copper resistance protein D